MQDKAGLSIVFFGGGDNEGQFFNGVFVAQVNASLKTLLASTMEMLSVSMWVAAHRAVTCPRLLWNKAMKCKHSKNAKTLALTSGITKAGQVWTLGSDVWRVGRILYT